MARYRSLSTHAGTRTSPAATSIYGVNVNVPLNVNVDMTVLVDEDAP